MKTAMSLFGFLLTICASGAAHANAECDSQYLLQAAEPASDCIWSVHEVLEFNIQVPDYFEERPEAEFEKKYVANKNGKCTRESGLVRSSIVAFETESTVDVVEHLEKLGFTVSCVIKESLDGLSITVTASEYNGLVFFSTFIRGNSSELQIIGPEALEWRRFLIGRKDHK
ncbi:MAG: hypothetical protein AAF385_01905 [Pseudomonadota bacterium]